MAHQIPKNLMAYGELIKIDCIPGHVKFASAYYVIKSLPCTPGDVVILQGVSLIVCWPDGGVWNGMCCNGIKFCQDDVTRNLC